MLHGRGVQDCSYRKKGIQVIFEETFTGHPFFWGGGGHIRPFACSEYSCLQEISLPFAFWLDIFTHEDEDLCSPSNRMDLS